MALDKGTLQALDEAQLADPFAVLGLHREEDGRLWMRAWRRGAASVRFRPRGEGGEGGEPVALTQRMPGLFEGPVPGDRPRLPWRHRL